MQLNEVNFLTWYDNTPDGVFVPLPMAGVQNCTGGSIGWRIGEVMAFHVNTMTGLDMGGATEIEVSLYTLSKTLVQVVGDAVGYANTDYFTGTKIYGELTCPVVKKGDYVLGFEKDGDTVFSSPIKIMGDEALTETALFEFRHDYNKNFIEYASEDLVDFYQKFRLFSSFHVPDTKTEKNVIDDPDAPKPREYDSKLKSGFAAVVSYMDVDKHFAMGDMLTCTELKINGYYYQSETGYTPQAVGRKGHSKGEFSVYKHDIRQVNRWPAVTPE